MFVFLLAAAPTVMVWVMLHVWSGLHFAFQRIDNAGSASPLAAAFCAAPIAVLLMTLLCTPAGGAGGVPCVSNGLVGAVLWPSAKVAAGGSSAIMVEQ
jgi:hypothetical protein